MRIIYLPMSWTILVDCIAWAIIQPGVAYLSMRFPTAILDPHLWLFRTRAWERGGAIYDRIFCVRAWKSRLPSGGTLFQGGFSMTQIRSREMDYLRTWVTETCRAELCHWVAILPGFLFFLWNPVWLGVIMVVYALIFNAIPIITQRYNRPRLLAIVDRRERKARSVGSSAGAQNLRMRR